MAERSLDVPLPDEAATAALAAHLATQARAGDVLALSGDLGAGKTAFARAFVRSLPGGEDEEVPSPTFTLVQIYETEPAPVWHFDLYRLEGPEEVLELGIDEAFADGISLIEWPDRLGGYLPATRLDVALRHADGARRHAVLTGHGDWAERLGETARWLSAKG